MTQITTVNPATGEEITTFSSMDKNQVFDLVKKARRAFPEWKKDYEDHYPCVGMTEFMHERGTWSHQGGFILKPSVGDFIIFPAELQHMAYPFKSKGERRTFSINASFIYNLKEGSSWDKIQQDSVDSQVSPTSVQYGAKK